MHLFSDWLSQSLSEDYKVARMSAPSVFLNKFTKKTPLAKWLGYIDQYVLLTIKLGIFGAFNCDYVLFADHSNSPSSALVSRRKIFVMVHDTIALRQARGSIREAPKVNWSGQMLQRSILSGIRRASFILSNPSPTPEQLRELGITAPINVVGCPVDVSRLRPSAATKEARPYSFVLNVASDGWRKRKILLVELWKHVLETQPDLRLILAGYTTDSTKNAIVKANLQERVLCCNNVSDSELSELYRSCIATVQSGSEEGFCIPVVESLHFQKPTLVPDDVEFYANLFGSAVQTIDLTSPKLGAAQLKHAYTTAPTDELGQKVVEEWSMQNFERRVRDAVRSFVSLRRAKHS